MSYPLFLTRIDVKDYVACVLRKHNFAQLWNAGVFKQLVTTATNETLGAGQPPADWRQIPCAVPGTGITGISIKWLVHHFNSLAHLHAACENGVFLTTHLGAGDVLAAATASNGKYLVIEWHKARFEMPDGSRCPCRKAYIDAAQGAAT